MVRMVLLLSTALFMLLSFLPSKKMAPAADLILFNGRIYTGNKEAPFAEAMAIQQNKIIFTGSSAAVLKMKTVATKQIDLKGKLVVPGFNDAHIHFLSGSLAMQTADLNACKTPEEAVNTVLAFANKHPEASWVTGSGWQYTAFPGGKPTRQLLDAVIKDRPVYIRAYDGHSAWVNSKALELAGITRETAFTGFGSIVKDADGEPTGMLSESAMQLVSKFLPPVTREEKLKAIEEGMRYAASLGITSVQNANGSIEELELYDELLRKGKLTLRYAAAFSTGTKTNDADINTFTALKNKYAGNILLRADAVKFMLDGVIESHTAVMMEPYSDAGVNGKTANGEFAWPLPLYRKLTAAFDKAGFRMYTHAIGDRSVHEALNAYERAQQQNKSTGSRHRIEHIEQCKPADVTRFQQFHVLPSMQPIHADPATVAVWVQAVGEQRLPFSFGWQSMLQQKATLVFGSDWPACIDLNPLHGLHIAVNRQTPDGYPAGGWIPQQRISLQEALDAYTYGGAYSSFEEKIKGKLLPGYLADFAVLSQNIFETDPARIAATKVLLTVMNGRVVYEAAGGNLNTK
ncbi:amidohydrolase [Lacibacter sp. MH-610]|uniref:amidohydrolase n=1 Tax=Lacibacter sp. MH-610 TaxID=3020883 RepID=UPI003892028E